MNKEELFLQKLGELRETAKLQGHMVTQEQIDGFAEVLELEEPQKELLYEYLKQNKIGIGEQVDLEEYLTDEDISYLDIYLKELEELPMVSESAKRAVSMGAMNGETEAKRQLVEAYLPYVVEVAKLYAGQGVLMEDLIGEGNVALTIGAEMLGALEKPEEVEGTLGKMIMDAMEEFIGININEKKTDKKVEERVNKVADKAKELSEELRRKVTVEELVEETGLSEKEVQDAMRISANKIEEIEG